jgi:hypothetical protein
MYCTPYCFECVLYHIERPKWPYDIFLLQNHVSNKVTQLGVILQRFPKPSHINAAWKWQVSGKPSFPYSVKSQKVIMPAWLCWRSLDCCNDYYVYTATCKRYWQMPTSWIKGLTSTRGGPSWMPSLVSVLLCHHLGQLQFHRLCQWPPADASLRQHTHPASAWWRKECCVSITPLR